MVAVFVVGRAGRFCPALEGYGYARMGYAVGVIDRSINRIHHPAVFGIRQPGYAFLSEHGYVGEAAEEGLLDQLLAADVQFQLDVVLRDEVGLLGGMQLASH